MIVKQKSKEKNLFVFIIIAAFFGMLTEVIIVSPLLKLLFVLCVLFTFVIKGSRESLVGILIIFLPFKNSNNIVLDTPIGGIFAFDIALALVLILFISDTFFSRRRVYFKNIILVTLFIYIAIFSTSLNIVFSDSTNLSLFKTIFIFVKPLVLYLLVINYINTNNIMVIVDAIIATVFVSSIALILQTANFILNRGFSAFFVFFHGRQAAFAINTNVISPFLLIGLFLSLFYIYKFYNNRIFKVIFLIILIAIFLTQSRMAWIITIILLPYTIYKYFKIRAKYIVFLGLTISIIIILFLNNDLLTGLDFFIRRLSDLSLENTSTNLRVQILVEALRTFSEFPMIGVGYEGFNAWTFLKPDAIGRAGAHNLYVEILVSFGLVGFISFVILILSPIVKSVCKELFIYKLLFIIILFNGIANSTLVSPLLELFFLIYALNNTKNVLLDKQLTCFTDGSNN